MNEQEVREQAAKILAAKEKIKGFAGIQPCIYHKLDTESKNLLKPWQIILRADSVYFFTTKDQVRRFLDGLEE